MNCKTVVRILSDNEQIGALLLTGYSCRYVADATGVLLLTIGQWCQEAFREYGHIFVEIQTRLRQELQPSEGGRHYWRWHAKCAGCAKMRLKKGPVATHDSSHALQDSCHALNARFLGCLPEEQRENLALSAVHPIFLIPKKDPCTRLRSLRPIGHVFLRTT